MRRSIKTTRADGMPTGDSLSSVANSQRRRRKRSGTAEVAPKGETSTGSVPWWTYSDDQDGADTQANRE